LSEEVFLVDFFRRQDWDIVGKSRLWLGLSAAVIIFGMVWWAVFGLNLGIDFTGGVLLRYQLDLPISGGAGEETQTLAQVRSMLQEHNLAKSQIQLSGNNQIFIRVPAEGDSSAAEGASALEKEIHSGLEELFGGKYGAITMIGRETVGPIVGKQLRQQALYVLGSIFILVFITIRYEFRFAVAAIIALLHDVGILVGGIAVLQIELDTSFVAALLTVIGYSINDTVVIFDRIRENRKLRRGSPLDEVVNISLLQTMTRSINTSITTLFALVALAGWGGTTIRGFAIALIIGIASGAYSSVFTASPVVVLWERFSASRRQNGRPSRAAEGRRSRRRAEEEDEPEDDDGAEAKDEKLSARETIRQAEAKAREEQRAERRTRRKKKSTRSKKRRY
jgi:preprotein translocase subunit SecF